MVVSAIPGVNRSGGRARAASLLVLALLSGQEFARSAPDPLGEKPSRQRGEILGVNREDRTFTLRSLTADGKELTLFHVTDETSITEAGEGAKLPLASLAAGQRVAVRSRRQGDRRVALEVEIYRPGDGRRAPGSSSGLLRP